MYDGDGDGRPYRRPPPRPPTYDEVEIVDDRYDPSPTYYRHSQWDEGAPPPRSHDPYPPPREEPRYSFTPPPPPAPYPMYPPPYAYPPYMMAQDPMRNKNMPVAGGILCIVSGVIGLIWLVLMWGVGGSFWLGEELWVCVVIQVIVSTVAIMGGIFAVMRRMFAMAIIGAVCSIMAGGLMFGFSVIMGILALILITIGKDSFDAPRPPVGPYY